jgi:hypothetical protein
MIGQCNPQGTRRSHSHRKSRRWGNWNGEEDTPAVDRGVDLTRFCRGRKLSVLVKTGRTPICQFEHPFEISRQFLSSLRNASGPETFTYGAVGTNGGTVIGQLRLLAVSSESAFKPSAS